MRYLKTFLTLLVLFMAPKFSIGQTCDLSQGQKYINNQQWDSALWCLDQYLLVVKEDSTAHFLKGYVLVQNRNYQAALESLSKAEEYRYPGLVAVRFNQAKCYAQLGQKKQAIQILDQLVQNGFAAFARLKDQEFMPIQNNEEFKNIYHQAEVNAYPCISDPNHRKFDFWLGEWDVYVGGQLAGTNSITLAKGGCAIHENWEATGGNHTGQSINYYHPVEQLWIQNWVGSAQDITTYKEINSADGMIQFQGKAIGPNGIVLRRMTFTLQEDGSVRQYIESSVDQGKSWTGGFDGKYVKQKKSD